MNEYEVLLLEKTFGRVTVNADNMEDAKKIALKSAAVEWDSESTTEIAFAHRID